MADVEAGSFSLSRGSAGGADRPAAGERLASVYGALAGVNAAMAAAAHDVVARERGWRTARAWARKAIGIWEERRLAGTLAATSRADLADLGALSSKCDLEPTRLSVSRGK